ncbi:MAG TPA: hypothetical protein VKG24_08175, partial [Pseudolabrys sp.]|nr:hypothetical protein [Pseudolabrys sp.]
MISTSETAEAVMLVLLKLKGVTMLDPICRASFCKYSRHLIVKDMVCICDALCLRGLELNHRLAMTN